MNFNDEIVLENERVKLRPLQNEDFDYLVSFALDEPTLWQYSLVSAKGESGMKNYISSALKARENKSAYPFIVYDKVADRYAGSTRFYDVQPGHKSTQLGYTWYGKDFWGTGLNKNCKFLMLEYMFEKLAWDRVEFRADNNNARSIAAMKSLGCTVEGIMRSHTLRDDGIRRDSIVLSILKDEWQGGLKEGLQGRLGVR